MSSINAKKLDGRQERGQKRRLALLAVARDLFVRNGYRGTTLEAIIGQAGGSREMIYSYFGGKAGLFGAIIAEEGDRLLQALEDGQSAALPPRQAFTQLGLRLLAIWESPVGRAINRTVIAEGLDSPELLESWYRNGSQPFLNALAHYIEAQIRRGQLVPADPLLVARQYQSLLIGETSFPAISGAGDSFDAAKAVERSVDVLMRAYGPAPHDSS